MFGAIKRKRANKKHRQNVSISFGTVSKDDLLKLFNGLEVLERYVPRLVKERRKGSLLVRTIDEYDQIQRALSLFKKHWGSRELNLAESGNTIQLAIDEDKSASLALALVELILVCRAVASREKLEIAEIASSLLATYRQNLKQ